MAFTEECKVGLKLKVRRGCAAQRTEFWILAAYGTRSCMPMILKIRSGAARAEIGAGMQNNPVLEGRQLRVDRESRT